MLNAPLQSTVWQGQVTAGDDYTYDLARNIREDNSRHFKMKALTNEILVQEAFREQQINEGLFVPPDRLKSMLLMYRTSGGLAVVAIE